MAGSRKWSDAECSFCGKSQKKIEKLIAGPGGVHICNECVELCRDILDETLGGPSPTQSEQDLTFETSPERERAVRNDRRSVLSAQLRALENLAHVNDVVRTCQDRSEAVGLLTASPFNFREIEAHIILDMGIGQQTIAGRTSLRQEIAGLDDSRDDS